MKRLIVGVLVVAVMFSMSISIVMPQDACEGDFDCDQDVDGTDAAVLKSDFGRSEFLFPCPSCKGPSPVPKTGQTFSVNSGDDGDLQKGVEWPNPRFTDNSDGTVTDNLTGLIWLKNANCFGGRSCRDALSDCNGLSSGSCGLTDGSNAGDWRLPNSNELTSLLHKGLYNPAVPNTAGTGKWSEGDPFTNVKSEAYWSSSYYVRGSSASWYVHMDVGDNDVYPNSVSFYVWPVRDPL